MVDPIAALVALFAADAGVSAAAEGRIFGAELPEGETQFMPRKALIVKASGGLPLAGGTYADAAAQRIDLFGYGKTVFEASLVRDAAGELLRLLRRTVSAGVLLHSANSAGGFSTGRDPEFGWPRAWQSFQLFYSLQGV